MKIEVEVTGVSQEMDFSSMKSQAYLHINILGDVVRVPISEDAMERVTRAAVGAAATVPAAKPMVAPSPPPQPEVFETQAEDYERDFSVMSGIAEAGSSPFVGEQAADQEEMEQIAALRSRRLPVLAGFSGGEPDDHIEQG